MTGEFKALNFFADERLVADPYPYFDALRAECPVVREGHHDVVMVTGYEEALQVFNDPAVFSSCNSVTGPFPGFPVPLVGDDVTELIERHRDELPMSDQLPTLDPPVHTAHRALLMRLITPKRLKQNEESMWAIADRLLDNFLAEDEGDVLADFAGPFTLYAIADLLGVPDADQEEFLDALQRGPRAARAGIGNTEGDTLGHNPIEFLYAKFSEYIEDRRRQPRSDVLTSMATIAFPDGSTPTVLDIVRVATNLFCGQETTVRLLGSALKLIAERADIQQSLRSDRGRVTNFIEEVLRTESPVKGDFRLARVPTNVGGVDIGAGTTVMVLNGAANRDPRRFDDPATFDAARSNARQHIAFGRGIHTCPGAPLARTEARIAIERLLDRTVDIRINDRMHGPVDARDYQYLPTYILRGLTALNIEFTSTGE